MKLPLTQELRKAANEMLDLGRTKADISSELGLSVGQVSALAAHRTMRRKSAPADSQTSAKPPVSSDYATIAGAKPTIHLGTDATGNPVSWSPQAESNPHLLVVGESGSGKTFAISSILGKLHKIGVASIVFDFGQGFSEQAVTQHLDSPHSVDHVDLARVGSALNPLAFPASDPYGPLSSAQRVADALCRVFPHLGIQQNGVIREAILKTYKNAGIVADEPTTWSLIPPPFQNLGATLKDWSEDRLLPNKKTAESVYAHISSLFLFRPFRSDGTSFDWPEIVRRRRPTIIHLRGLSPELQRTLTEFLLWNLISSVESHGPAELKQFVILDEAHRIPSNPGSALDFLLREGRKYGVATIVGSQQPEDFSSVCLTNTAAKLVFNIGEQRPATLRRLFRGISRGELQMLQGELSRLSRGTGFFTSSSGARQVRF